MTKAKLVALMFVLAVVSINCGPDRKAKLRDGVSYARSALEQAGANPLSQASYRGYIDSGGTPVDYIKATMPKENPVFDSYEYNKPTHTWTIVIRPSADEPGEYSIEGYADNLKQPEVVEHATVKLPEQ
jgi:hypothetical protein